jgi:hypothetical protein
LFVAPAATSQRQSAAANANPNNAVLLVAEEPDFLLIPGAAKHVITQSSAGSTGVSCSTSVTKCNYTGFTTIEKTL